MLTPAKILKLWNRVNDRFGLEEADDEDDKGKGKKKPSPKVKQAEKENERISKGLTRLRNIARGDLGDPSTIKKFTKAQDKTVKSMKKYCKLLKGSDLKDSVQDLGKLRKAAKQLTIAVEELGTGPFAEDEGEVDLAALTEGWPPQLITECEQAYTRSRWSNGSPTEFRRTLAAARFYWAFRWLGDSRQRFHHHRKSDAARARMLEEAQRWLLIDP